MYGIVDGLPNCEEVFNRILLVCGYFCCGSSVNGSVLAAIPYKEVSCRTALGLGPSLEDITGTCLRSKDVYCFVDLEDIIALIILCVITIKGSLSAILTTVVAVPSDMGRSLLFLIFIYSFEFYCVVEVICTVCFDVSNSYDFIGACLDDSGICLKDRERSACRNGDCCVFVCCPVPSLEYPVIEILTSRCCRCGSCCDNGVVLIQCRVCGCVAAAISIINHADTVSSDSDSTPLGVKVKFLSDPETISAIVSGQV